MRTSSPLSLVRSPLLSGHERNVRTASDSRETTFAPVTTVQERFRSAREALGLSQVKLARKLGYHVRTVARWENGRSALPAEALDWVEREASKLLQIGQEKPLADRLCGRTNSASNEGPTTESLPPSGKEAA